MRTCYLHFELAVLLVLFSFAAYPVRSLAQGAIYANSIKDSSSDFRNVNKLLDNDRSNYAYLSNAIGVLSTSYLRVGFPASGEAGNVVSVVLQGTGQLLGVDLLSNITVRLYDSTGANVATGSGSSLLQLSLLSKGSNMCAVRFLTNPTSAYRFKEARIEFKNILSVNLLNELRVYDIFYEEHCPAIKANGAYTHGSSQSSSLLQGYVTNPGNITDADDNNFATLVVPLNLLNILPPAYLDVAFTQPAEPGEYLGFTVSQATTLLSLALLQNITITGYDDQGNSVVSRSGSLLNLRLLAGAGSRYTIGFVAPSGTNKISRLRITLKGVLNLLQNLNVYNAFHYRIVKPPVVIVTEGSTMLCSEGSITLTAIDSLGGTNFTWSTGEKTQSISVSSPGTYWVNVTDPLSCDRQSYPITISEMSDLELTASITNTKCNNTSDGAITIANATTGSFNYKWSNGATGSGLSNISAGLYLLTITNTGNGCVYNRSYTVSSASNLSVKKAVINTSNIQKADGAIIVSVAGGSGNYQYSWSSGETSASIANVKAGIYYLTVTDLTSGCGLMDTVIVNDGNGGDNTGLTIKTEIIPASQCGPNTGSITLIVSGGSGSYSYLWSNGATTSSINNLQAGLYYVAVTDNSTGIVKAMRIVLNNTGQPEVNAAITAADCNKNNGSIQLVVSGGSGNYSYIWNTNATTAQIDNLGAGIYYVTVTDKTTLCTQFKRFVLQVKAGPMLSFTITKPNPQLGTSGSITVNENGDYSYSWSNGSTEKDQKDLLPGIYTLKVTDNGTGCMNMYELDLTLPASIFVTATPLANTDCGHNNGTIILTTEGGVPPYVYQWSNGGSTQNISNIGRGEYSVIVSDAIGNNNNITIPVTSLVDCDNGLAIHDVITPNGDGANDAWVIEGIASYPDNNIKIFDKWGDKIYEQSHYNNTWGGTDRNNDLLPAGTYYYLLKLNATGKSNIKTEYTGFITVKR